MKASPDSFPLSESIHLHLSADPHIFHSMRVCSIAAFIVLVLIPLSPSFGQRSLVVTNIDLASFPRISGNLFTVDSLPRPELSSLHLFENGVECRILRVDCPDPAPPVPIASVLTIDVSSSMGGDHIAMARAAAHLWIDELDLGPSRCAITSFSDRAYLNRDFTVEPTALHAAVDRLSPDGGTSYDAGLIDPIAGGITVASTGTGRRVLIFLTDGQGGGSEPAILAAARDANVRVYTIALDLTMPPLLRRLATETGGAWFERIASADELRDVYLAILRDAQGREPCTLVWESQADCNTVREILIVDSVDNRSAGARYVLEQRFVPALIATPRGLDLGVIPLGSTGNGTFEVEARGSDVVIERWSSRDALFSLVDRLPISVANGTKRTLTVRGIGNGSPVLFGEIKLHGTMCDSASIIVRVRGEDAPRSALRLDAPNGGERYALGDTVEFRWSGILPNELVRLEMSYDAGGTWAIVADSVSGLSHRWRAVRPSDSCVARVVAYGTRGLDSVIVLRGHISALRDVDFSPDGSLVATGGIDNVARIWSATDGAALLSLPDHERGIYSVDFSPDGGSLLVGTGDLDDRIWNLGNPTTPLRLVSTYAIPNTARYSPDGSVIATGTFGYWTCFWKPDGSLIDCLGAHTDRMFAVAFSRDGAWLATGSYDGDALLWKMPDRTPARFLKGHKQRVDAVAFNPDGTLIATGSYDGTIRLWSVPGGDSVALWNVGRPINALAFTSDGSMVIDGETDGVIRFRLVLNGALARELRGHTADVTALSLSPDGDRLASASFDNTARLWDLAGGRVASDVSDSLWAIVGPNVQLTPVDFGPHLVGTAYDSTVAFWVCNGGEFPLRIDTIIIASGDSAEFGIVRGSEGGEVPPGECRAIELRFVPLVADQRRAVVRVVSGEWSQETELTGIGIDSAIRFEPDPLDFGTLPIGSWRDLQATVQNISFRPTQVDFVDVEGPDSTHFAQRGFTPIVLMPGASTSTTIRFQPAVSGRTTTRITLRDSTGRSLGSIMAVGQAMCEPDSGSMTIGSARGGAGSRIEFPVLYDGAKPGQAIAYTIRIRLHRTLLIPIESHRTYDVGDQRIVEVAGEWDGASDTVATIPFIVALGDTIGGAISLDHVSWDVDCAPTVTAHGGSFDLTDLCSLGPQRLIRDVGDAGIISIVPNPVTTTSLVEYRLAEDGPTRMDLYDLGGRNVRSIFDGAGAPGRHSIALDRTGLPNGSYVLRLTTPTVIDELRVLFSD